ncbi:MAG: diguanylate cyclase, partial [Bacilli bacterium]|nr:diguanylate cyclase [Bacilli bacterium]
MKKKSLHLSDAVFIIAFSTIFLGALFSVGLYLIFRFKIIILVLLLFLFVLTGGVIILLGKIIIEKPIREFEKSMRSLSLSVRPVATLSRLNEIRNINRAIRKLWLQSHQMTSCLFSTIELYSVGFFYYLKEDDKVYCTQKFFDICAFKGKEGYLDYRKFHPMYQKITNLYYDDKYRAYLLEDFRWIQILTHQYRGFCMGIIYDITDQVNQIKKIEKERDIDPLTGLYNRYAFNRLSENIISDCSIKALALIMWDIDKLKYIN